MGHLICRSWGRPSGDLPARRPAAGCAVVGRIEVRRVVVGRVAACRLGGVRLDQSPGVGPGVAQQTVEVGQRIMVVLKRLPGCPMRVAKGRGALFQPDRNRRIAPHVARWGYLARRDLMERDLVFVQLPDASTNYAERRRMARVATAHRPHQASAPRRDMRSTVVPPVRSEVNSDAWHAARPGPRASARAIDRPTVRLGAPHFIIWSKNHVLQVELKTTRGRLLEIERAFGNALNTLGHVYHVLRAETPRHAVELVQDLLP